MELHRIIKEDPLTQASRNHFITLLQEHATNSRYLNHRSADEDFFNPPMTPLGHALLFHKIELTELLLANPYVKITKDVFFNMIDWVISEWSPASRRIFNRILERRNEFNINMRNDQGLTVLHVIMSYPWKNQAALLVQKLVRAGANPKLRKTKIGNLAEYAQQTVRGLLTPKKPSCKTRQDLYRGLMSSSKVETPLTSHYLPTPFEIGKTAMDRFCQQRFGPRVRSLDQAMRVAGITTEMVLAMHDAEIPLELIDLERIGAIQYELHPQQVLPTNETIRNYNIIDIGNIAAAMREVDPQVIEDHKKALLIRRMSHTPDIGFSDPDVANKRDKKRRIYLPSEQQEKTCQVKRRKKAHQAQTTIRTARKSIASQIAAMNPSTLSKLAEMIGRPSLVYAQDKNNN